MKKQLLIIGMMLLMAGISKAQYQPVLEEGKSWNYFHMNFHYYMDSLYISGDTIIDGMEYLILLSDSNQLLPWTPGPEIKAFLREDTTSGKIWSRTPGTDRENLYYDISLEKGDMFSPHSTQYEVLDVVYENGKKILKLDDPLQMHDTIYMIEGIGSTGSIHFLLWDFSNGFMICAHNPEGKLTWETDYRLLEYFYLRPCWLDVTIGIEENTNEPGIKLWPNPASKSISIELPHEQSDFAYQIIDAKGRTCATGQITGACQEIDVAALANGIYVLSLKNDKQHLSETIIIER